MPESIERYSEEEALKEASELQEKIKSGEASTYHEAEKIIEGEKKQGAETPEQKLRQEFLSRVFLVVEDNPDAVRVITKELREERGTAGEEKDESVIVAENYDDFNGALGKLLKENGPTKITAIFDLEFPYSAGGQPIIKAGVDAVKNIQNRVETWNSEHPDRVVTLEIIINSTTMRNERDAQKRFGPSVGWSGDKGEAVFVVRELIQKQIK